MPDETLTFSELRKIQKKESRQDELSDLDDNFILQVSDYFTRKEELGGKDREYKNARRVFEKIISLREEKIIRNAKIAVESDTSASDLNLLPFEQELFRELKGSFKDHRQRANERTEPGSSRDLEEQMEKRIEEEKEESDGEDEAEGYEQVRIISEVPEFMGTDLQTYGPFETGETVKVPEENAEILVNRGNAEPIEE